MMIPKRLFLLVVIVLLSNVVYSQKFDFSDNAKIPTDKDVIIGKFDNGMTYYIRKNETPKNRAELKIATAVGSINEDDDQRGLAHFLEHMAFNGSKHFKKDALVNFLESIGMKFGADVNAYTSFNETVFRITIPTDKDEIIDRGLLVLNDWSGFLTLGGDEIDKERGVIHEEWRLRAASAGGRMSDTYFPKLYKGSKYAHRLPIGLMEIVDKCPYDNLRRYYRDWYRPDLQAIIIVGDFDLKKMEEKVKKVFSAIPKKENPRKKEIFDIPINKEPLVAVVKDKEARYSQIQISYRKEAKIVKTIKDFKEELKLNMFNIIILERLLEKIYDENPPYLYAAAGFSADLSPLKTQYSIMTVARNNMIPFAIRSVIASHKQVLEHGFTATELERAKLEFMMRQENIYKERYKRKSVSYTNEYTRNFLTQEHIASPEFYYQFYKQIVPQITLKDINAIAKEWIKDESVSILVTGPDKAGVNVPSENKVLSINQSTMKESTKPYVDKVANKPLIGTPPKAGKIDKKQIVENQQYGFVEWTLSNGAKVVIKQTDFKDDEIKLYAYSKGGLSLISDKDAISARMAVDIVDYSGISDYNQVMLRKKLTGKRASVTPWISQLEEGISGSSNKKDFQTMLELTYLYFTKPRKDKSAFTSFMNMQKGSLENADSDPESAFKDTIKAVLSNYHPRAIPMSLDLLKQVRFDRVDYIYRNRFVDASDFTFIFVGNIDPNDKKVKQNISKFIGGLPSLNRKEQWKDLGIRTPKGIVKRTVYKGIDQKSYVYIVFNGGFEYNSENKIKISLLSEVLSKRLREAIREDEGGTYSISASPNFSKFPISKYQMSIWFSCDPKNVEKLSKIAYNIVEKLKQEGPNDIELNDAKEIKIRARETNLRKNNFWTGVIKYHYSQGQNYEEFNSYTKLVKNQSKQSLKEAANKFLNNKNYVEIVLKPEK